MIKSLLVIAMSLGFAASATAADQKGMSGMGGMSGMEGQKGMSGMYGQKGMSRHGRSEGHVAACTAKKACPAWKARRA